jgi:hypothetical protein
MAETFRHLHACSGCFRLERSPGGLAPTGKRRLFTAHTRSGSRYASKAVVDASLQDAFTRFHSIGACNLTGLFDFAGFEANWHNPNGRATVPAK